MKLTTVTSTTMLNGLRDPANDGVWQQFVDRYRPLLVGYARKVGFSPDDAEDVAQETLAGFSAAYRDGKYQREKGRLRSWLFGIAHNQMRNARRRAPREVNVHGPPEETDFFARVESREDMEALWEREWQDAVLKQCLEEVKREVKPQTVEAFRRFALEGKPAEDVAADLGITANAVFGAKRRVLQRIRDLLPLVEEIW